MNYLDLFAGAGGLSEGFARIGAEGIAHIELDHYAAQTLETRVAYYYLKSHNRLNEYRDYQRTYHLSKREREIARSAFLETVPQRILDSVINMEISEESLPVIFELIQNQLEIRNIDNLDLIIGGPPCQAYSVVGRSRTGKNNENDSRHYLYRLYVQFLERFTPKAFVFENVPGIYTAKEGAIFEDVRETLENAGYSIKAYDFNAFDFGVPQNRKRVIIMGFRNDLMDHDFEMPGNMQNTFEVTDFFTDLPLLKAGETFKTYKYKSKTSEALIQTGIRNNDDILTHHVARGNIERDLEIYKEAVDLWNCEERRLKYSDLRPELITHKNTSSFLDRFKVVSGNLCYSHTVVAHISKDGHHYIHPDIAQNRSITVREAARLQSFPDDYFFEGPRTANFVQIGNAVPPLMAEGIARWFLELL
jgi:DNA (cytosine-5)-methyltransferase 1